MEVAVDYRTQDGRIIPATTYIMKIGSHQENGAGWQGFTQILLSDDPGDTAENRAVNRKIKNTASSKISDDTPNKVPFPHGVAVEGDKFFSVDSPISTAGKKCLHTGFHTYNNSTPEQSATLAVPVKVHGNQNFGLLEILDGSPNRSWKEDERRFVEQIANQLSLALENALLYKEQLITTEKLRELDKLKSEFIASVSHELRTPLNAIIGFSRIIMKGLDGPVTDLQKQDLKAIYNSGHNLLEMINDILDISKIEAGKMELNFQDVRLQELILNVIRTAWVLVKGKPIELHHEVPPDLPPIQADPGRVHQVLLNLLSNAAKFTEEGSITISAELRENSVGIPEVIVSVTDTGRGISPDHHEKLFQPFTQLNTSSLHKMKGTGLGLSISRHLVEMHGGWIGFKSHPGEGSTFSFSLPVTQEIPPKRDSLGNYNPKYQG